jgi:AraC-like DNA-binding protein
MQIAPHPLLSSIVKHYLIIVHDKGPSINYRLFSDGNPGMVFHLKEPLLQRNPNHNEAIIQPRSFVYGQITHYNDIISTGKLYMLVVVLQPNALLPLLGIAAHELNNNITQLKDIFGQEASDLEDQIAQAVNSSAAIAIAEQFLLKKISAMANSDRFVGDAINSIYKHKGLIKVQQLLNILPVTERQLERKFSEQVGISPKKFIDSVKFQNYLKLLQKIHSTKDIAGLSYACGYYDQAHLNNYFRKHTGVTPLQYKANHNLLAINFMPLT